MWRSHGIPNRWRRRAPGLGTALNFPGFRRNPAIVDAAMKSSEPVLLRISNAIFCVLCRCQDRASYRAAPPALIALRRAGPTPSALTGPAPLRSEAFPALAESLRVRARGSLWRRLDRRLVGRAWRAQARPAARSCASPASSRHRWRVWSASSAGTGLMGSRFSSISPRVR
jgi:hypothetical protein